MTEVRPIFVLSLPRSGSTLLQRMLATHPQIATATEPWILLPQLSALQRGGTYAEYHHKLARRGIEDFAARMPNGMDDYRSELARFVQRLYTKASPPNTTYFVDKTPRYSIMVDEVVGLFPEAPLIFLWRNPISMVASVMSFVGQGHWTPSHTAISLYRGLSRLVQAQTRYREHAYAIQYEDLIADPVTALRPIYSGLGLTPEDAAPESFDEVRLEGLHGDRVGMSRYREVSGAPLRTWSTVINNSYRKAWTRRYLRWIGEERLSAIGYSLDPLLEQLKEAQGGIRGVPSDIAAATSTRLRAGLELHQFKEKLKQGRRSFFWGHH